MITLKLVMAGFLKLGVELGIERGVELATGLDKTARQPVQRPSRRAPVMLQRCDQPYEITLLIHIETRGQDCHRLACRTATACQRATQTVCAPRQTAQLRPRLTARHQYHTAIG